MEKKTKLTISGSAKKSIKNIEIAKNKNKNSVDIEKLSRKFPDKGRPFKSSPTKIKKNIFYGKENKINNIWKCKEKNRKI